VRRLVRLLQSELRRFARFFAMAAPVMRRIVVDVARERGQRRSGVERFRRSALRLALNDVSSAACAHRNRY
jgi:ECF sigma factor